MALRQRPSPADGLVKNQVLDTNESASPPASAPHSTPWVYKLLFAVAVSGYVLIAPQAPKTLPASYALCSREGNKIYTVDETNSQTQCIVIHQSHIVDKGVLREFREGFQVRGKYSDLDSV